MVNQEQGLPLCQATCQRIISLMQLEYMLELASYWTYRASHYFMVSLVDDPAYLALIFT